MVMGVVVLPSLPLMTPVKYCFGPTEPAWAGPACSPTAMTATAARPSVPDDRRRLAMIASPSCAGARHACPGWPGCQRTAGQSRAGRSGRSRGRALPTSDEVLLALTAAAGLGRPTTGPGD